MKYLCPVCGYNELDQPPNRYNICPSCGTEFDSDDLVLSHSELRKQWIDNGTRWWSEFVLPPNGWDPFGQLLNVISYKSSLPATYKTEVVRGPLFQSIGTTGANSTVNFYPAGVHV